MSRFRGRYLDVLNGVHRFCVHKIPCDSLVNFGVFKEAFLKSRSLFRRLRNIIDSNFSANALICVPTLIQVIHVVSVHVVRSFITIKNALCFKVLRSLEFLNAIG